MRTLKRFLNSANLCALVVLGAVLLMPGHQIGADCGSIPFYAPQMIDFSITESGKGALGTLAEANRSMLAGSKDIDFDPLQITIFEPKQRAIILWNGQEEVLLLSTDQRASQKTAVLEVIPLPSRPTVRLGSFKTFEEAQKLVVRKRMWAVAHGGARAELYTPPATAGRIAFHQKMGAHEVTVAEALNNKGFVDFVQHYLMDKYKTPKAPIRPEFVAIIDSYLKEGFRWFAFDVIAMSDKTQSRQPIEYRFKSESVFYPMRISTLERGKTEVDLLVFSPNGATRFEGLERRLFDIQPQITLTTGEIEGLDKNWKGFFKGSEKLVMDQWRIKGKLETFVADVRVK